MNYKNILTFLFLALLISCSSYDRKLQRAIPKSTNDSVKFAKLSNQLFPPTTKYVKGNTVTKVVTKEDKTKVNKLTSKIDSLLDENITLGMLLDNVPNIDSLKKAIKAQVIKDCAPKEIVIDNSTVDTIYVQDSTQLFIKQSQINKLQKDKDTLTEKNQKLTKWVFYLGSILLIILLIGGVWLYIKFKPKITL